MTIVIDQARKQFKDHFGHDAQFGVRAPGRVNIIGEHTDYNHGYVMPMALERDTIILASRRRDNKLCAFAATLERSAGASLDNRARNPHEHWLDYIMGVADELAKIGKPLVGADLMVAGNVPIGCGLSSSASLEMASLAMFETLGGFSLDGVEAARLGQRVENEFLGLNSGVMDQFISRMGRAGHALFLDCRTFEFDHVPVRFQDATFVIANTCLSRGLTSSKYNERVAECNEAVEIMAKAFQRDGAGAGSATHLRDFTLQELADSRALMPDNAHRRARHVIGENERARSACDAMRNGDAAGLGDLMNESDRSLRDDYEVTSPELDAMTRAAREIAGCYGARMTGAGFGGCTINLVSKDAAEEFSQRLMAEYLNQTGYQGDIIASAPGQGAGRLF